MTQPQTLTQQQLLNYANQLQNGTLQDVHQVYADLYSKGYNYAGWAGGVASEDTIAGVSAVNFLTGTALMGWGGPQCRNLSSATLDSIRVQMAREYVDALVRKAEQGGGSVSEDVNYRDCRQFHQTVFQNHNLSLDNWTLNTPMELVRQSFGDDVVEALWKEIRDTGGDGIDGTLASVKLYNTIGRLSFSEDSNIRDQALAWMDQVPGFANWEAIGRSVDTVMEWLDNTVAGRLWNALHHVVEGDPFYLVTPLLNTSFNAARNVVIQRDPLVLDLDGDGLELTAASGNVLFDHNADGIRTGTGWAKADDGFLVRDLNGNGVIDSGRELFGVDTLKSNGQLATQGFDALADLDSNGDGQITSADAAWSQLKVWRDLNQDGISQSNELSTLAGLNITRIGLNGTSTGPQAGQTINNNRVALSTTYTRGGVTRTVGAIDLEANAFFSEIPPEVVDEAGSPVTITETAAALPQMNGSGMVRNLRAAMSLTGTAADELEAAVNGFAAATTRDAQRGLLDNLITEWAQTSSYWSSLESTLGGTVTVNPPAGMTAAEYRNMIAVLEAFNGSRFYNPVGSPMVEGQAVRMVGGVASYTIAPPASQAVLLKQAYKALTESVYGALAMQTRLKPYLDSIGLVIDENGVSFDTAHLDVLLDAAAVVSERVAIMDLVDLHLHAHDVLAQTGYDTLAELKQRVGLLPSGSPITAELQAEGTGLFFGTALADAMNGTPGDDTFYGEEGSDTILAGDGDDEVFGGAGNDIIDAGGGDDVIHGEEGDDTIVGHTGFNVFNGGAGNDSITGRGFFNGGEGDDVLTATDRWSRDTYYFRLGDGKDTIDDFGHSGNDLDDRLVFASGIAPSTVRLQRSGNDMVFKVNANDQVTVKDWYAGATRYIEKVMFADDTEWGLPELMAMTPMAYNANESTETINGWDGVDVINGLGGNDTINTLGGNDTVDGGDGNDTINAGAGNDLVYGGAGADIIDGGAGNDTLDGGEGNDTIVDHTGYNIMRGGAGNDAMTGRGQFEGGAGDDSLTASDQFSMDTYYFKLGDGKDTIIETGSSVGGLDDRIVFGPDIAPSGVSLQRSGNDMVFKVNADDQVTVKDWFVSNSRYIEKVMFADGTEWGMAQLLAMAPTAYSATADAETINGWDGVDVINGLGGNDTINTLGGNDTVDGGDGNDTINAGAGNDLVYGGAGADIIDGGAGNDTLDGGEGNDTIVDHTGYNIMRGGAGNDAMTGRGQFEGGAGDDSLTASDQFSMDTYYFKLGDGKDTIIETGSSVGGLDDRIVFGPDIAPSGVSLQRSGNDMVFKVNADDQVTVKDWFVSNSRYIEKVMFADGTEWGMAQLLAMAPTAYSATADAETINGWDGVDVINGLGGNDTINTLGGNDTVDGGDGNDTINAGAGNDLVYGGAGNDILDGGDGHDVLDGGEGGDTITDSLGRNTLRGGAGNDSITGSGVFQGSNGDDTLIAGDFWSPDTYLFNVGDGRDKITDYGGVAAGREDILKFGEGIAHDQLWLRRSGNDLNVQRIGTTDSVEIKDWYVSASYKVEIFKTADNKTLLSGQVDALVSAMAAFSPPPPGQTTLTPAQQTALSPVIAANWT